MSPMVLLGCTIRFPPEMGDPIARHIANYAKHVYDKDDSSLYDAISRLFHDGDNKDGNDAPIGPDGQEGMND